MMEAGRRRLSCIFSILLIFSTLTRSKTFAQVTVNSIITKEASATDEDSFDRDQAFWKWKVEDHQGKLVWGYSFRFDEPTGYAFVNGYRCLFTMDVNLGTEVDTLFKIGFPLLVQDLSIHTQLKYFFFSTGIQDSISIDYVTKTVTDNYVSMMKDLGGRWDPLEYLREDRAEIVLHTFGDSNSAMHWSVLDKARKYVDIDLQPHWLGSKLMNSFNRDKKDLLDMNDYTVEKNDIVMFSFGYIDISHHQYKFFPSEGVPGLHRLVDTYFETIKSTVASLPTTVAVWVHGLVPPKNEYVVKPEYQFKLVDALRTPESGQNKIMWTLVVNNRLRRQCKQYGYEYMDLYDEYADEEGYIKREHTFMYSHVYNYTAVTKTEVADAVKRHMKKNGIRQRRRQRK